MPATMAAPLPRAAGMAPRGLAAHELIRPALLDAALVRRTRVHAVAVGDQAWIGGEARARGLDDEDEHDVGAREVVPHEELPVAERVLHVREVVRDLAVDARLQRR